MIEKKISVGDEARIKLLNGIERLLERLKLRLGRKVEMLLLTMLQARQLLQMTALQLQNKLFYPMKLKIQVFKF